MEIRDLISTMNYTLNELHSKRTNSKREDVFSEFMAENEAQPEETHENSPASVSMIADNGVKSTLMLGRLESQKAQESPQSRFTAEELQAWHGWGSVHAPEGMRWCTTGQEISECLYEGTTIKNGVKSHDAYYRTEYIVSAYYDETSPEDAPVMYVHYDYVQSEKADKDILLKIDVNSVDPSNATYDEMLALVGYIYRDDPQSVEAGEAQDVLDKTTIYMEIDGIDWRNGAHDYRGWLGEFSRRNHNYPDPSNQRDAEVADILLDYLKDYPRGSGKAQG